jgi:hypothetical protein
MEAGITQDHTGLCRLEVGWPPIHRAGLLEVKFGRTEEKGKKAKGPVPNCIGNPLGPTWVEGARPGNLPSPQTTGQDPRQLFSDSAATSNRKAKLCAQSSTAARGLEVCAPRTRPIPGH